MRDGSRVKVDEYEWMADRRAPNYRQIHAFGSAIVYQLLGE